MRTFDKLEDGLVQQELSFYSIEKKQLFNISLINNLILNYL